MTDLRLKIKIQSDGVSTGCKRLCFGLTLSSRNITFKPAQVTEGDVESRVPLSKKVPLMNDGSACSLVHRLEDVSKRDTRVDDEGGGASARKPGVGKLDEAPMLTLTMNNYVVEDFTSPEGRSEVDIKLRDVIVVVLPTQLSVSLKSITSILDSRVMKGEPPFLLAEEGEGSNEMEEGFFDDDDESDGSDFEYLRGRVESDPVKDRSSTNTSLELDDDDDDDDDDDEDDDEDDDDDDDDEYDSTDSSSSTSSVGGDKDSQDNNTSPPSRFRSTPAIVKGDLEIIAEQQNEEGEPQTKKGKDLSKFFGEDAPTPGSASAKRRTVSFESESSLGLSEGLAPRPETVGLSQIENNGTPSTIDVAREIVFTPPSSTPSSRHGERRAQSLAAAAAAVTARVIPPQPPPKSNGTLFNGADVEYKVSVHNLSVALLLDEKILDAGIIDFNIADIVLAVEGSKDNEEIKLRSSRITARGCRLSGSTFYGEPLKLHHLPFKSAVSVGPVSALYSASSRHNMYGGTEPSSPFEVPPSPEFSSRSINNRFRRSETFDGRRYTAFSPTASIGEMSEEGELDQNYENSLSQKVIGTVYVSVHLGVEYVKLNLTPSLNAIFAGCIDSLNATFAKDEEEVREHESEATS